MTDQEAEKIIIDGEERYMIETPFDDYLENHREFNFLAPTTSCWRGYYGKWELRDKKLYLIELQAFLENYKKVDIDHIFPGKKVVFADWYNGEININDDGITSTYSLYFSEFENGITLVFDKGILVEIKPSKFPYFRLGEI